MDIGNEKQLKDQIETIANVHELEINDVIDIMESQVFPKTIRQNFPKGTIIETTIDRDTFNMKAYRIFNVVDVIENESCEKLPSKDNVVGDVIREQLHGIDLNKRNSAIIAKQVLLSEINKLKKKNVRQNALRFKNNLINVIVKKYDLKKQIYFVEFNGEFSGILPFKNLINQDEKLKVNERYWALMTDEEYHRFQDQVIFSRTGDEFIRALFAKEVPEVHDEIITIKDVYFTPEKKVFVSVHTSDKNIDPIGTCVGVKGSRVNNIIKHLNGGSIDICRWEPEISDFILSIFKGLNIEKISILDNQTIIFINEDEFQKLNHQNKLRLKAINKFSNEKVRILTEERFLDENKKYIEYFMESLNIDQDSAELIANSGFYKSIDDIASYSVEDTADILDIDEYMAEGLIERAIKSIEARNLYLTTVNTNLVDIKSLKKHHLDMLLKNNINNVVDLADLANDELCDLIPIDIDEANDVIMEARNIIYN